MNVEFNSYIDESKLSKLKEFHQIKLQQSLLHYKNALDIKEKMSILKEIHYKHDKNLSNNIDYVYMESTEINSKSNISNYGLSIIPKTSEKWINHDKHFSVNDNKITIKSDEINHNCNEFQNGVKINIKNRSLINPYSIDKNSKEMNGKTMILNILDIDDIEENHFDYDNVCLNFIKNSEYPICSPCDNNRRNNLERKMNNENLISSSNISGIGKKNQNININNIDTDDVNNYNNTHNISNNGRNNNKFEENLNSNLNNLNLIDMEFNAENKKVDYKENVIRKKILKKYFKLLLKSIKYDTL